MRQQYHARRVGADVLIWDVTRLVEAARNLPVLEYPLERIAEIDELWWYGDPEDKPTPRSIAAHVRLMQAADLAHPILLCAEGRLMDGMHRVLKALAEGRSHLAARRFPVTPDPHFRNLSLNDLPYPDAPA